MEDSLGVPVRIDNPSMRSDEVIIQHLDAMRNNLADRFGLIGDVHARSIMTGMEHRLSTMTETYITYYAKRVEPPVWKSMKTSRGFRWPVGPVSCFTS